MRRRHAPQPRLSTQRIEAFSDGVFAIAITLLVLEIKIPQLHSADQNGVPLSTALLRLWPSYFGYVFSFLMIGIYWANHHYIFHLHKQSDHVFALFERFLPDVHLVSALPYCRVGGIHHRSGAPSRRDHLLCVWAVASGRWMVACVVVCKLGPSADRSATGRRFRRTPNASIRRQH